MGSASEREGWDGQEAARQMVDHQLRRRGLRDERVLTVMSRLARHRFVPNTAAHEAYGDGALPTADGQTISQPYMVGLMTELLDVGPGHRVLEIGTGSGYQTAILLMLGAEVVSVERSAKLIASAERRLTELDRHGELGVADRLILVEGDGTLGCPAHRPYDRILVTAGAPNLPPSYREQLADGGRIVIPVGDRTHQELRVYSLRDQRWDVTRDVGCRFVPLVGEQGWPSP